MYSVSNDYKRMMKQPVQSCHLRGTVGTYSFTEDNVIAGSLHLTDSCVLSDSVILGSVYVSELKCTFTGMNISRTGWKGLNISFDVGTELDNGTIEWVPCGLFTIETAKWTVSGIDIVAYGQLSKFDADFDKSKLSGTKKTPYAWLTELCTITGTTFGMTQTEVEALPNGTEQLALREGSTGLKTWRDLLSSLAQVLGGYAVATRAGSIIIRNFTTTTIDTIDEYHRFNSCSFEDSPIKYTSVRITDRSDGSYHYYSVSPDDGGTIDLGENPFLQVSSSRGRLALAALNAVVNIHYTPFNCRIIAGSSVAYDLGDVITFSGGIAGEELTGCIMKQGFTYGREMSLQGVGGNEKLASAKSKTERKVDDIEETINDGGASPEHIVVSESDFNPAADYPSGAIIIVVENNPISTGGTV